ncbi:MAG TPA: ferritin-like domain-containing protein [Gaiellaceae bacterium]|nr:ferritin-like domain-containing protein [Gaiellaceae bacterium]
MNELEPTLAEIDVDGALQETAAAVTRGDFLRRAATVTAAAAAGALVTEAVAGAAVAQTANDIAILRFDQVLEYLQAGLYTEAERLGALKPETLAWARVVGAHERAHLQAIKLLLGEHAVKSPGFNYAGVTSDEAAFVKTAVGFEDLTAALLKWQAPRLDSREIVAAAVSLHSVETRHAAWIRKLVGLQPATTAFDKPASQQKMAQLIDSTHFLVSRPVTSSRKKPRYTG